MIYYFNSLILSMKIDFRELKLSLYETIALKEESKLPNDPIFRLLFAMKEIQAILSLTNFTKYLYLDVQKLCEILYELEEQIKVDDGSKTYDLYFYYYLFLLIAHNPDIINYIYSFDFVKEINHLNKKESNNFLRSIIISKIILKLIYNFEGFDDYEENEYEEEIEKIKKENLEIIEKNLKLIGDISININKKFILNKNIDEIYIEIISQLIKNDKLSDYDYSMNIISQLDLQNIDLNTQMFEALSAILSSNEENVTKYNICEVNDLLNDKIINFHFILLKYIIKSSIYIYQIPFLYKVQKKLIKIIKTNIYELISFKINEQHRIRLEYVLEKYSDLYYYFNNYLNYKLVTNEVIKNRQEYDLKLSINSINKKANINNNNNKLYKEENPNQIEEHTKQAEPAPSTRESTNKIKYNESAQCSESKKIINYNSVEEIQNLLFNKSIFLLHTNEKECEPYIIYDKIFLGKNEIEINENQLYDIEKKNNSKTNSNENYIRFLKFLDEFKIRIKNEFKYNYRLKLKLEFTIDIKNQKNQNSIYNIICIYTFYNPINNEKLTFKDDNILINYTNSSSNGFLCMMNEINDESFKDKEYEEDEANPKIREINNKNNISVSNTNVKLPIDKANYSTQNNISVNNLVIKAQNNYSTKCCTQFDYLNKEADKEEIIVPIKIFNRSAVFIMQLSNGYYISYEKDSTLIVYDHAFNCNEINNLKNSKEFIYNISEKKSNYENSIELIVCCIYNIYLIQLNKTKLNYIKSFQIPTMSCYLCYEINKNEYILSGETSTIFCKNLFKEEKSKVSYNKISKDVYRSGKKIADNIIALSSNNVIKNGKDNLSLYNTETQKMEKISGYSYIYEKNGLSFMKVNGYKILLCACKKYLPEQKNGIVIVNLSNTNNEIISENFFATDNFEVNCFMPILKIKNNNVDKLAVENVEIEETEYFFAGGFDEEKGEGIIQLYKIFDDNEENIVSIEYLQDIDFVYNEKFRGFEGNITCIEQSKINGNILINSSNGNIYLFSKPNLEYYLNETEI